MRKFCLEQDWMNFSLSRIPLLHRRTESLMFVLMWESQTALLVNDETLSHGSARRCCTTDRVHSRGLFILALDGKAFTKSKSTLFPPRCGHVVGELAGREVERRAGRSVADSRFPSAAWSWCSKKTTHTLLK